MTRTKESLIGFFVETKGRNAEILELGHKLGFEAIYFDDKSHPAYRARLNAKVLTFSNSYYGQGSVEFTNSVSWAKENYKEITVEELLDTKMDLKLREIYVKNDTARDAVLVKLKSLGYSTYFDDTSWNTPTYIHTWEKPSGKLTHTSRPSVEWSENPTKWTPLSAEELLKEDKEEMKTYTVSEEFIKEAHKAACSTWKTKLEEQFPEVFPKTYHVGQRFISDDDEEYLLAQVDRDKCCLISLECGNRNVESISVDSCMRITEAELKQMSGCSTFKLKQ
jgi:hypothetical protein